MKKDGKYGQGRENHIKSFVANCSGDIDSIDIDGKDTKLGQG